MSDLREWAKKKKQEGRKKEKGGSWNAAKLAGGTLAIAFITGASYYIMSRDDNPKKQKGHSIAPQGRSSEIFDEGSDEEAIEEGAYRMVEELIPIDEDVI